MNDTEKMKRLVKYRRDLHRIPELDRDLPKTAAYVKQVLNQYDCEVFSPAKSAVCAFFDCGAKEAIAFRSDMDALPVTEKTGRDFASTHEGCMHACGHDGHMAMLLTFAGIVNENKENLKSNILLVFQPAEETTGGARYICESKVFEKYHVKCIFGFHLWPELPQGVVASRSGDMLARSSETTVTITGKSSHIAKASEGRDALWAGVLFVERAYAMIENEVPAGVNRLLKFGRFESGTVRNAISAGTTIMGSLRSFSADTFEFMKKRLCEIGSDIEKETGCSIDVHFNTGYPAVINDEKLYRKVAEMLPKDMLKVLPGPYMIAEDFSYYQQVLPGMFMLLGTGRKEPLHADNFDFDESILLGGVGMYEKLMRM